MGLIPEDIVARVIDRSDIVEVISAYVPLKRAGRNFKTNCPFHNEKTPSFVVNPDKQIFHCFGCGVGGNSVSFVMQQERIDFPEAIRILAKKVGISVPENSYSKDQGSSNVRQEIFEVNDLAADYFHKILLSDKSKEIEKVRAYLKDRDISLDAVKQFKLGFAADSWDGLLEHLKEKGITLGLIEKAGLIISRENREGYYDRFRNRIIFPIFDTRGHCRAFGARALESDEKGAKYINSPETIVYTKGHHLYGFHLAKQAIGQQDSVIITEGYLDCLMPYQNGINNIVASLGTALTTDQIRLIRRYTKNVVMLFDTDKAGQAAMMRSLDALVEEGMFVKVVKLSENDDPDSFIRKYGADSFKEQITNAVELFDYKLNTLSESYNIKEIEGKAHISSEMLITISKFDNEVVRSTYVSKLSKILGVPESSLLLELKKISKTPNDVGFKNREQKSKEKNENLRAVETNILRLLLEEESYIKGIKDDISLDDFQDVRIRNVISEIYDLYSKGKKISFASLINKYDDQNTQEMISALMNQDEMMIGDKEKMYRDCVNRIKSDKVKLKRQDLLEKIREAESAGNTSRLDELTREFNTLIKK
ncbi:MAG: DNA primase [Candidatus Zapsychrus exili]|nr:DNA primase [Candidatus Zapsychrus exili]